MDSMFSAYYVICADSLFLPGSQVIPTLELIGVGGLLPRMIFHRLEPMFEYPREMGFPYIYIYCISISRVFLCFLFVFFFFCFFFDYIKFVHPSPLKMVVFCRVLCPSLISPFFGFDFFGPIQRDGIW